MAVAFYPCSLAFPQHPDEHCPQGPVLLAIDQELGEGAALRVAPELTDPVGAVEVGEQEDVEQLGSSRWRKGLEALRECLLHLVERHESTLEHQTDSGSS